MADSHSEEKTKDPPEEELMDSGKVEWVESELTALEEQLQTLHSNHETMITQFTASLQQFRQLLDTREKEFIETADVIRGHKEVVLEEYKKSLQRVAEGKPPPVGGIVKPQLHGGLASAFLPDLSTLFLSTTSLITTHSLDVAVGDTIIVNVIGGMGPQGAFWVRVLPSDNNPVTDIILQNISNSLQARLEQGFVPLSSPQPGEYCAVRYSVDQRWYRGRVTTHPRGKKVSVFFLDYGNTEEMELSSLAPLDDGYRILPPQMIRCCFSAEEVNMSREAKWKFADLTHSQNLNLTARLLSMVPAPPSEGGRRFVVKLMDQTDGQEFDIGPTVMAMAEVTQHGQSAIRYRDVRYKNQPLPPSARQTVSGRKAPSPTPSSQPSQPSPSSQPSQVHPPSSQPSQLQIAKPSQPTSNSPPSQSLTSSPPPDPQASQSTSTQSETNDPSTTDNTQSNDQTNDKSISNEEERAYSPPINAHHEQAEITEERTEPAGEQDTTVVNGEKATRKKEHTKPLALIKPLNIDSENFDSKSSVSVQNGELKDCLNMLHPDVKVGAKLTLYVTTSLSADGIFWAHLETTPPYETMMEKLQSVTSAVKDEYTPVFFSMGDLCAAQFTEDQCWYRGRVEGFEDQKVFVRYLDYGNEEGLSLEEVVPLQSQFMTLPGMAIKCSLATDQHTTFTQLEIDRFTDLETDDPVEADVVGVVEGVVRVQLWLKVNKRMVNINEEVWSADCLDITKTIESMEFSLGGKTPPALTIQESGAIGNSWADQMDEIASPVREGLTLAGSDGERFTSPSPTPDKGQRWTEGGAQRGGIDLARAVRIMKRGEPRISPASSPGGQQISPRSTSRSNSPASVKSLPEGDTRRTPRLAIAAHNSILSHLDGGRSRGVESREKRSQGGGFGTSLSQAPPTRSTRSSSPWGRPRGSSPPTRTHTTSPLPWKPESGSNRDTVTLFVKNVPENKNQPFLRKLFSLHGKVFSLSRHKERANVYYVEMSPGDADKAISALHGKSLDRYTNPLVVEITRTRCPRDN